MFSTRLRGVCYTSVVRSLSLLQVWTGRRRLPADLLLSPLNLYPSNGVGAQEVT